jgi:hypothetical protein
MKLKIGSCAVMVAGALATAIVAQGQTPATPTIVSTGAPASDLPLADYQAFDKFAAAHPETIRAVSQNLRLLEDRDFLAGHPELSGFLATHAELREALIENPGNFIEPSARRHHP